MIPRFHLTAAVLLALAAGLLVYGSLLLRAQPLERDDQLLLQPLESVHSPADYVQAWRSGRILDVAPVRDLSYLVDLKLGQALGRPTFTLTNFALWLAFTALALSLFRALGFGDVQLWVLLLLLAAHPAYAVSVAWIASRKHLLAGCFALTATLLTVKPRDCDPRSRALPAILYALSVLSHPIHILWPLWAWAWRAFAGKEGARQATRSAALPLVLMAGLGALNAWYYSGPYVTATGGIGKFAADTGALPALLSLGRAAFNLLLPVAISPVDYFPGSWPNLAGLALLPAVFFVIAKRVPWRTLLPWSLFFFLPQLLLNARATRIFLSDTYLLLPSVGLWILLAEASKGLRVPRAAALVFAAALSVPGLFTTRALAASFASMDSLFDLAFAREATPQVTAVHAKTLFERGRLREAAELSFAAIPEFPAAEIIFAQAVARNPALKTAQKLELLAKAPGREPATRYFTGVVLAEAHRYAEARAAVEPLLANPSSLGDLAPAVAADARDWAIKAGGRP